MVFGERRLRERQTHRHPTCKCADNVANQPTPNKKDSTQHHHCEQFKRTHRATATGCRVTIYTPTLLPILKQLMFISYNVLWYKNWYFRHYVELKTNHKSDDASANKRKRTHIRPHHCSLQFIRQNSVLLETLKPVQTSDLNGAEILVKYLST